MGKKNKQHRAAKQRTQHGSAKHRNRHAGGPGPPGPTESRFDSPEAVEQVLLAAARMTAAGQPEVGQACAESLLDPAAALPARLAQVAACSAARHVLSMVWGGGWQPQDLHQMVRRRLTADHLRLVVDLIGDEATRYPAATTDLHWLDQLSEIGARVWWLPDTTALGAWTTHRRAAPHVVLELTIELLGVLMSLPKLPLLLPLPGTVHAGHERRRPRDAQEARALARVRGLLAKAESTDFPDEAETLSAKAQELMARHSLHRLVVEAASDQREPASARRLWLDAPYANAKAQLVSVVAEANRCQAVWAQEPGFVTIIGDERDLVATELLVTSLLVQATHAMVLRGEQALTYGHQRTRSFRQSFLVSYATRIGERLRGATEAVAADIVGKDLLPVLVADSERVEQVRDVLFPSTVPQSIGVTSNVGWAAGRAAADLASLDHQAAISEQERAS